MDHVRTANVGKGNGRRTIRVQRQNCKSSLFFSPSQPGVEVRDDTFLLSPSPPPPGVCAGGGQVRSGAGAGAGRSWLMMAHGPASTESWLREASLECKCKPTHPADTYTLNKKGLLTGGGGGGL